MPFTFAHPLVVVPLRRVGLPLTALAVGAMIPDLVLFAPLPLGYGTTHSLVGILTVDLVLGALLLGVWRRLVQAPLTDAAPRRLRARLPAPASPLERPRPVGLILAALGLVVGAVTHVVWDAFTHSHGWVVQRVPALQETAGPLPISQWLQYASSLIGVVGLALIVAVALDRRTPVPTPQRHPWPARAVLLAPAILCALMAGLVLGAAWSWWDVEAIIYVLATRTITAAAVGLALGVALWWIADLAGRPVQDAAAPS